jgi:hypothetical protein
MRPESPNTPLPDNGSLIHVSVITSRKEHLLSNGSVNTAKAGIVEPDTE